MRYLILLGCICAFWVDEVSGAITSVINPAAYAIPIPVATTNLTFTFQYENTAPATINHIWVVDPSNIPTTNAECRFPYSNGLLTIDFEIKASLNPKKLSKPTDVDTSCFFENTGGGTTYKLYFLTRESDVTTGSNDILYSVQFSTINLPITNDFGLSGTQAFPPFPLTTVTPVDYDPVLSIHASGGAPVTQLALGDAAFLRVTMSIPGFVQNLDDAGCRVLSCIVSHASDFSSPETIVDANGCFTSVLVHNNDTSGFQKKTDGTTFTAETPLFAVFNIFITNTVGNKKLYFQCNIQYCTDTSVTTPGTCGGDHCSNAPAGKRKRREDTRVDRSVTASIEIVGDDDNQAVGDQCTASCDMGVGYKAAIGGLSGIAIILLFGMVMSYRSVMKVYEERRERCSAREQPPSTMTTTGKTGARSVMTSASSVKMPTSVLSSRISGSKRSF